MSTVPISFEISGVQSGWAIMDVCAGDASYRIDGFSYTTDAFDDLVRFGVDIALNAHRAEIILDGEPSGWSLSFHRTRDARSGGAVETFCVHEIDNVYEENSPRAEALRANVSRDQVSAAIEAGLSRLEADMGVENFEAAWMQAYPVRGMAALRAALGQSPRRGPDRM